MSLAYSLIQGATAFAIRNALVKAGIEARAGPIAETRTLSDGTKYIWTHTAFNNLPKVIQKFIILHENTHLAGFGEIAAYLVPWIGIIGLVFWATAFMKAYILTTDQLPFYGLIASTVVAFVGFPWHLAPSMLITILYLGFIYMEEQCVERY